jgi:tetratricopeptide (TPR) repeat protein
MRKGIESGGLTSIYHLENSRWFYPYSHQNNFHLGIRYAEQGWNQKAIESFNRALIYQEDIHPHKWLSYIYQRTGQFEKAIEETRRIIEINPVFPGHYRDLITLLKKTGQTDEISILEEKALDLWEAGFVGDGFEDYFCSGWAVSVVGFDGDVNCPGQGVDCVVVFVVGVAVGDSS